MQRRLQEVIAERDAVKEEAEELYTKNQELWAESSQLEQDLVARFETERCQFGFLENRLRAELETERAHSAQLQQRVEELEAKLASVPPMTAPTKTEYQSTPEVEQTGSDEDSPTTDTQLLTAGELAKMFPVEIKYAQRARDLAKSKKGGAEKLRELGYEAVYQDGSYLFRKLS